MNNIISSVLAGRIKALDVDPCAAANAGAHLAVCRHGAVFRVLAVVAAAAEAAAAAQDCGGIAEAP